MCGIIGYTGYRNATEVVVEGLKRLEYRGYDSAGIAVISDNLEVYKSVGGIDILKEKIPDIVSHTGIGHTRWATHGRVCEENAHPHVSCDGKIAIIHNGIIENFLPLREELENKGHKFLSETDTEVIVHLIEENYDGNLEKAVINAVKKLHGSYAILVISLEEQHKIVGARKESPLVIGVGDKENFIASDIPAFLKYTNRVKYMEDGEICIITPDDVKIIDMDGKAVSREEGVIEWKAEEAEKGGFPHYMLKEIHEQPKAIVETMRGRISELDSAINFEEDIGDIDELTIIACGTSYYAGLIGKYAIENITGLSVKVEKSSEYRYFGRKSGTVIGITQSGETADTLAALKEARMHGCKTIAITNVNGSTVTRVADITILTRAGPEIGVAATKTFTTQIITLFLLALYIGIKRGVLSTEEISNYISNLKKIPSVMEDVLAEKDIIKNVARNLKDKSTVFYIGRGVNYPIALEGALKLKEISYVHAEGFAAGELKHGPFALLTDKTPVVSILSKDVTYEKLIGNIEEIKARNSPVIAITEEGDREIKKFADHVIYYPHVLPILSPLPISIIVQLLAYYTADFRGCSIDKPRNLAKSVTVE